MYKSERREQKRNKRHSHRVHANFDAQYNAMMKREQERKARVDWREARGIKESV